MIKYIGFFLVPLTFLIISVSAQTTKYDLAELAGQNKIKTFNRELTKSAGDSIHSIHLSAKENDGVAWINGLEFSNGIIEVDIKGKDILQQSFVGIAFHGVDEKTLDAIYFRPFNFKSEDPIRKIHAVQYVSHPDFPWAVLREKYNGKYEKGITPGPNPNTWFHVKIVVGILQTVVFVNKNTEPCLTVERLNKRTSGKVGFWVGNNSDGDFANLTITKQ
ncbi:MAG: hypothetical protein ABIN97_17755 [Ginsengibacter sp.]